MRNATLEISAQSAAPMDARQALLVAEASELRGRLAPPTFAFV